ncbi:MAG: 3-dehydroquinate synthase, partial [Fusobacteriaceae bacterium]
MKILDVKVEKSSYKIYIGQGTFSKISDYIKNYDSILLLSNKKVGKIYSSKILEMIPSAKYFEIEDGEEFKEYQTVSQIYDFMIENKFYRNSLVICLGGGVVCDIGGYVAATFMRGIDFVQMPTSLLAQVDASVGGKVAINHGKSKNLIGAFYQPKAVIMDTDFLQTLDKEQFLSGMGEVIKHAIIYHDKSLMDFLLKNKQDILDLKAEILEEIIHESCKVKRDIVEADEKENSVRAFLNLGHTYGHAVESIYDFKNITHGEGVAKGIIFELEISKNYYAENQAQENIDKLQK